VRRGGDPTQRAKKSVGSSAFECVHLELQAHYYAASTIGDVARRRAS